MPGTLTNTRPYQPTKITQEDIENLCQICLQINNFFDDLRLDIRGEDNKPLLAAWNVIHKNYKTFLEAAEDSVSLLVGVIEAYYRIFTDTSAGQPHDTLPNLVNTEPVGRQSQEIKWIPQSNTVESVKLDEAAFNRFDGGLEVLRILLTEFSKAHNAHGSVSSAQQSDPPNAGQALQMERSNGRGRFRQQTVGLVSRLGRRKDDGPDKNGNAATGGKGKQTRRSKTQTTGPQLPPVNSDLSKRENGLATIDDFQNINSVENPPSGDGAGCGSPAAPNGFPLDLAAQLKKTDTNAQPMDSSLSGSSRGSEAGKPGDVIPLSTANKLERLQKEVKLLKNRLEYIVPTLRNEFTQQIPDRSSNSAVYSAHSANSTPQHRTRGVQEEPSKQQNAPELYDTVIELRTRFANYKYHKE